MPNHQWGINPFDIDLAEQQHFNMEMEGLLQKQVNFKLAQEKEARIAEQLKAAEAQFKRERDQAKPIIMKVDEYKKALRAALHYMDLYGPKQFIADLKNMEAEFRAGDW